MVHPVAEYLNDLHQSLGVGVPETSGYPALRTLLNAVGETLKPKISAVLHPANAGAGIPDGGLFSTKELRRHDHDAASLLELKPERGVIEVKPLAQDIAGLEQTPQVRGYLEHYGQILITNYRTFALFSWENGKPVAGERYVIAANEQAFWEKAHTLRQDNKHPEHDRLWQFLRRALLSTARISTPQDLAAFLASYAREARARVEVAPMGTLEPVKKALSDALGVHFEGERGTHFFQSTLVQTLFYGIFSAWVLWHEESGRTGTRFQWRLSAQHLGLPILRTLFIQLANDPKKIRALHLEEVLDWTEECLARVDRESFFARYDMGDAVQYFYEPFLAEFDPELRENFGVWYTPPEVVRYMVGQVDATLRENFNLPDGLADPSVVVLDPCCGTGAFLVETLRLIYRRLVDGYGQSQAGLKIRDAAKKRLYGFELLPAPYVVSHLQIDLMLSRWGAPFNHEQDERAGVYLTNALTGWVPIKFPKDLPFSEFKEERDAADHVKQQEQILVILGNPPYDGYAGITKIDEERALTEAYRTTKEAPEPSGQGLNELFVRFFRMAERRIAEGVPQTDEPMPGRPRSDAQGIVCYISNYSWLDGLSHTGMRERFMEVFDAISIDCLNGDKYKTGKKTPDGKPDPSVFSTEKNREGIQVGTAIALMERRPRKRGDKADFDPKKYQPHASVRFRHWWGSAKRAELEASLTKPKPWVSLQPALKFGLPLTPLAARADYETWPKLTELLAQGFSGIKTARDRDLVSIELAPLQQRMAQYFDPKVSDATARKITPELMSSDNRFDAIEVRNYLQKRGQKPDSLVRYCYRPFDVRWLYWEPETKLLDERRAEFRPQTFKGNLGLVLAQKTRKGFEPPIVSTAATSYHVVENVSLWYPLMLAADQVDEGNKNMELFTPSGPQPNLTDFAKAYLERIKASPEELFFHIVAVTHAPLFRAENGGALALDWPRIPLPKDSKTLRTGATMGRQVAALLDPEAQVPNVTGLQVRTDLKGLGELAVGVTPGTKKPEPDLSVIARWGYTQKTKSGEIVMPGPGRVEPSKNGNDRLNIYLNATTYWKEVPEAVWNYTLGGYQVLKKWLSYRESALLGRALTADEAQQFTHHVRRIAAILSLHPELDRHYQVVVSELTIPSGKESKPSKASR